MTGPELTIRAAGPAVEEGRLALTEVARISGELQATLERIAMALLGSETVSGRRPQDIVNAVRLELTDFASGSAILEVSPPSGAMIMHDLLGKSVGLLMEAIESIDEAQRSHPEVFGKQVLDGLVRLSGGISPRSVRTIEITRINDRTVVIDDDFRRAARAARNAGDRSEVTIVGRLHMGDFAPAALRCRVDTISTSVSCTFDESLTDDVLNAMGAMVVANGIAELLPDGRVRSLDLLSLTKVNEAKRANIGALAQQQGIAAVRNLTDFPTVQDVSDEEFEQFIRDALSAR